MTVYFMPQRRRPLPCGVAALHRLTALHFKHAAPIPKHAKLLKDSVSKFGGHSEKKTSEPARLHCPSMLNNLNKMQSLEVCAMALGELQRYINININKKDSMDPAQALRVIESLEPVLEQSFNMLCVYELYNALKDLNCKKKSVENHPECIAPKEETCDKYEPTTTAYYAPEKNTKNIYIDLLLAHGHAMSSYCEGRTGEVLDIAIYDDYFAIYDDYDFITETKVHVDIDAANRYTDYPEDAEHKKRGACKKQEVLESVIQNNVQATVVQNDKQNNLKERKHGGPSLTNACTQTEETNPPMSLLTTSPTVLEVPCSEQKPFGDAVVTIVQVERAGEACDFYFEIQFQRPLENPKQNALCVYRPSLISTIEQVFLMRSVWSALERQITVVTAVTIWWSCQTVAVIFCAYALTVGGQWKVYAKTSNPGLLWGSATAQQPDIVAKLEMQSYEDVSKHGEPSCSPPNGDESSKNDGQVNQSSSQGGSNCSSTGSCGSRSSCSGAGGTGNGGHGDDDQDDGWRKRGNLNVLDEDEGYSDTEVDEEDDEDHLACDETNNQLGSPASNTSTQPNQPLAVYRWTAFSLDESFFQQFLSRAFSAAGSFASSPFITPHRQADRVIIFVQLKSVADSRSSLSSISILVLGFKGQALYIAGGVLLHFEHTSVDGDTLFQVFCAYKLLIPTLGRQTWKVWATGRIVVKLAGARSRLHGPNGVLPQLAILPPFYDLADGSNTTVMPREQTVERPPDLARRSRQARQQGSSPPHGISPNQRVSQRGRIEGADWSQLSPSRDGIPRNPRVVNGNITSREEDTRNLPPLVERENRFQYPTQCTDHAVRSTVPVSEEEGGDLPVLENAPHFNDPLANRRSVQLPQPARVKLKPNVTLVALCEEEQIKASVAAARVEWLLADNERLRRRYVCRSCRIDIFSRLCCTCGHLFCTECCMQIEECPVCETPIQDFVPVSFQ